MRKGCGAALLGTNDHEGEARSVLISRYQGDSSVKFGIAKIRPLTQAASRPQPLRSPKYQLRSLTSDDAAGFAGQCGRRCRTKFPL